MKKNTFYTIIFISLILMCFVKKGVCADSINVQIQTDQKVYVSGEKIWIDGVANHTISSKYILVELIDRSGITKTSVYLYILNTKFSGYLKAPGDGKTDFYFLRYSLEKEATLTSLCPLIVINPLIKPDICPDMVPIAPSNTISKTSKKISLNKQEFFPNEWVRTEWDSDSSFTDVSVYVRRKDKISDYADSILKLMDDQLKMNKQFSKPGAQKVKIKVTSALTGSPVPQTKVWASVLGQKARISYGISSDSGEIAFNFPIIYGQSKIVFSLDESSADKINIEQLDETFTGSTISFPCLHFNETMREDIEERLLHVQLQEKYGLDPVNKTIDKENDTTDFYGNAKLIYFLDDFVRFPDIRDIFSEIIPEIRVKNAESDKPKFQILNQGNKDYFEENALILLDGVPVKNNKHLLNFDALKIKSIEVIDRNFYLGDQTFHGIIHFKTYTNDLSGFNLPERDIMYPFTGVQFYSTPIFKHTKEKNAEHQPDFRNILYREINPSKTDPKKLNFQFLTSNATGIYEIEIIARTKTGDSRYFTNYFKVNSKD